MAAGQVKAQAPSTTGAARADAVDPATVTMPDLTFTETPQDLANYDKYYYFVRANTDFTTAYADIRECDGYARGLSYRPDSVGLAYPYAGTLGGALGSVIGDALADAIYGSAERRSQRRINMRTCMAFKGYQRFGLPKDIWVTFNFEEGLRKVPEDKRQQLLQIQAKVASGPLPAAKVLHP